MVFRKRYQIRIDLTEAKKIAKEARRLGISRSEFVRRVAMGQIRPDWVVARELLKITFDLADLEHTLECDRNEELKQLADEIKKTRTLLELKIKEL